MDIYIAELAKSYEIYEVEDIIYKLDVKEHKVLLNDFISTLPKSQNMENIEIQRVLFFMLCVLVLLLSTS